MKSSRSVREPSVSSAVPSPRWLVTIFYILVALTNSTAFAELNIFDVRKNLALSDAEPTYRDFYINGGSESGLAVGMIVTVQRRLPLYDSYQNRSAGDLHVRVARVKLIHVQRGLSVARLHSEFSRESAPLLEDNFIMMGDSLDLASASGEKKEAQSETVESSSQPVAQTSSEPQIVVNSVVLSSKATPVERAIEPQNPSVQALQ